MIFNPYGYQQRAIDHIMSNPFCGLFLDMGLGKTVCALTAAEKLIRSGEIMHVLVVAPLRVARTVWAQEAQKWDHLNGLKVRVALGSVKQREAALHDWDADIYVINRENVPWLVSTQCFNFDMVILDELSSFKHHGTQRFKSLKKVFGLMGKRLKRVVGLTGTPMPNGLMDLWSEIYLIDRGVRLGKTFSAYRDQLFRPAWGNGMIVYKYEPLPGAQLYVQDKIKDICICMKKEDYLDMPDLVFQNVVVELDKSARKTYRELEKESVASLGDSCITAMSAGAVNMKLQQLANGAVYDEGGQAAWVHDAKLDALEDLIEQANGQPVLVFTTFRHDIERIKERLGEAFTELKSDEDIAAWNEGRLPVAGAHPASIGHGLNLQYGGHIIVWFGLTWSLELYEQANNRLYRQGQKDSVSVYHLVAGGTVDEACLESLVSKSDGQKALMDYLSVLRKQFK